MSVNFFSFFVWLADAQLLQKKKNQMLNSEVELEMFKLLELMNDLVNIFDCKYVVNTYQ